MVNDPPQGDEQGENTGGNNENNPLVAGDPGNEEIPFNFPVVVLVVPEGGPNTNVVVNSAHSPEPVTMTLSVLGLAAVGLKLCRRRR